MDDDDDEVIAEGTVCVDERGAPEAETAPSADAVPDTEMACDAEATPVAAPVDAEPASPAASEVAAECAVAAQAGAADQQVLVATPVARLVDRLREHPVDCFRCSQTRDGLWHTVVHALELYRELFAITQWCDKASAEKRWYAALAKAGIERGEECSTLRWPQQYKGVGPRLSAKVHRAAYEAVATLCWHSMLPLQAEELSLFAFTEEVIMPSLLCLHEQALQPQFETLRETEEALKLENLHSRADTSQLLGEVSCLLPRTARPHLVAQLYCAAITTPSRGMQCAYQKTKCDSPAVIDGPTAKFEALSLSPLPEEALPIALRQSIDSERAGGRSANWGGGDSEPVRPNEVHTYNDLYSRN